MIAAGSAVKGFQEVFELIDAAEAAVDEGDQELAGALLLRARDGCEEALREMGVRIELWGQWLMFEAACMLQGPLSRWRWSRGSRQNLVRHSVQEARRLLETMAETLADAEHAAERGASLAGQLEDLLDEVWRREREWEFDTRLRLARWD